LLRSVALATADAELADLRHVAVFRRAEQTNQATFDDVVVHPLAVVIDADDHHALAAAVLAQLHPDIHLGAAGVERVLYQLA
jgi:hypothetical protein